MEFYSNEPTVTPFRDFNVDEDVTALRKAMKGIGTDEDAIIDIVTHRTFSQREQLIAAFKNEFGRDLIKDLKDELGGKFEDLILALMCKPAEFLANELNRAMKGIGTDEELIMEILCTRNNADIQAIVAAYQQKFGKPLEEAITSEVSGHFRRILVMLLNGARMEGTAVSMPRALEAAQSLYNAGEGTLGTDEEAFTSTMAHESFPQLRAIFDEYRKIAGKTVEQAIKSEFSGDIEKALLTIAKCAINHNRFFADKLESAMKGAGTDDLTLIRIIVSRCEIDLGAIKREYEACYGKTLYDSVKNETSGDYKKALLALIGSY